MMDASHLSMLPPEMLEEIVQQLIPHSPIDIATVIDLARTRTICLTLKGIIDRLKERPHHTATIRERYGVTRWEHVAIAVALKEAEIKNDGGMRIGFKFASMDLDDDEEDEEDNEGPQGSRVPGSRPRIGVFAAILERHPRATARVDAHTGPTCPSHIAQFYSAERAEVVVHELAQCHGISRGRLTAVGHGKRLSASPAVLEHSTHPNAASARSGYGWAEVFISIDGIQLPARPDFYDAASLAEPPNASRHGASGRLAMGARWLFRGGMQENDHDEEDGEHAAPMGTEHVAPEEEGLDESSRTHSRRCVIS